MKQRNISVSVVAGGWSFSRFPQKLVPGHVIAVNDSAFHLERAPNSIVTMDRMWAEHRIDKLMERQINTLIRRSAAQNLHEKIHGRPWFHVFDCDHTSNIMDDNASEYSEGVSNVMTDKPYCLNGTNSGMCGLNLAYVIWPKRVFLFGFDMQFGPNGAKHWYPDYDWPYQPTRKKLHDWTPQFRSIRDQFDARHIEVYNVSNRSNIDVFAKLWIDDMLEMAA